jgi:hypothetical protein
MGAVYLIIFLFVYFVPTIIAHGRNQKNIGMTVVINLFTGWTFIGWVIALAMAFGDKK